MKTNQKKFSLVKGELSLSVNESLDWHFSELLEVAERINPKRAFLFVSKVLGKHIPVSPKKMNQSYIALAKKIGSLDPNQNVTFIAMAETAVGLGSGVYREYKLKSEAKNHVFMTTTRHRNDGELVLAEFQEEHSHAHDQLIHLSSCKELNQKILDTEVLVMIDDEMTTGKTFLNLFSALQNSGLTKIKKIITLTLADWSGSKPVLKGVEWENHSLISGSWHWEPNADAVVQAIGNVNGTSGGSVKVCAPQNWGRSPTTELPHAWVKVKPKFKGERIHVLGSAEFLWVPFLIAEDLEKQGANVIFSSTTRSPINVNGCINSALTFKDNYGLGMQNYAYNVDPDSVDRIILVVETPQASVPPELTKIKNLEVVSYINDKPIAFVDLDDTLFQTHRRIKPKPNDSVASYGKSGEALGFMSPKQKMFVEWLGQHSIAIPVTARSVEALSRVNIDFKYGAVCSHGGAVLLPNGELDPLWHSACKNSLRGYTDTMEVLKGLLEDAANQYGSIRTWIVEETGLQIYLVAKQNDLTQGLFLTKLIKHIPEEILKLFYIHSNGNNLAIIPTCISKKAATEYLIKQVNCSKRAVLGFGDSHSDIGFLGLCDWFALPQKSQLASSTLQAVDGSLKVKGFYGND